MCCYSNDRVGKTLAFRQREKSFVQVCEMELSMQYTTGVLAFQTVEQMLKHFTHCKCCLVDVHTVIFKLNCFWKKVKNPLPCLPLPTTLKCNNAKCRKESRKCIVIIKEINFQNVFLTIVLLSHLLFRHFWKKKFRSTFKWS